MMKLLAGGATTPVIRVHSPTNNHDVFLVRSPETALILSLRRSVSSLTSTLGGFLAWHTLPKALDKHFACLKISWRGLLHPPGAHPRTPCFFSITVKMWPTPLLRLFEGA